MLKQKMKTILQSCVRVLAKWKVTHIPVSELINYAFIFGTGWLVCYVMLSSLSPLILAVLGGVVAGALIAPMLWLPVAILLHQVDKERQDNELATIDALGKRIDQLDERYRESVLARWQVSPEPAERPSEYTTRAGEGETAMDQQ